MYQGSSCTFRHCYATLSNYTPCKFWASGSCLNPDCPFRHPPTSASITVGTAPIAAPKSTQPCVFYNSGSCKKGNLCAFSHDFVPGTLGQQQQPQAQKIQFHVHNISARSSCT